MTLDKSV